MAYTAFVHGATGLFAFGRDSILMRGSGNLGVAPSPRKEYEDCKLDEITNCEIPADADLNKSQNLWSRVSELNTELEAMKAALLSPTNPANYTIDPLQTPNTASAPIRSMLKTTPAGTYLIAVNMINDKLEAVFQLQTPVTSVSVQFENRTIATPLAAIRDQFGPFAVHIYRWQ